MSATLYFARPSKDSNQGPSLVWVGNPDRFINMANSNARLVWVALGFDSDFEESPSFPVSELITACRRFRESELEYILENGHPAIELKFEGVRTVIYTPIEGYIENKVDQILIQAYEAREAGGTLCYIG